MTKHNLMRYLHTGSANVIGESRTKKRKTKAKATSALFVLTDDSESGELKAGNIN